MDISDKLIRHWATICEGKLPMGAEPFQEDEVEESARDDVDHRVRGEIERMMDNQEEFLRKYSKLSDAAKRAFFMRSSRALDEERTDRQFRLITNYKNAFGQLQDAIGFVQTLQTTNVARPEDAGGFEQAAAKLVSELDGMRPLKFEEFIQIYARCIDGKKLDELMKDGEGTARYFPETAELYKILAYLVSNEGSAQKFIGVRNDMDWDDGKASDWPEEDPEVYEESAGGETGFQGMFRMMVAQQTDDRTVTGDSPEVKWWTDRAKAVVAARRGGDAEFGRAADALIQIVEAFGQDDYQDWPQTVVKTLLRELCGK